MVAKILVVALVSILATSAGLVLKGSDEKNEPGTDVPRVDEKGDVDVQSISIEARWGFLRELRGDCTRHREAKEKPWRDWQAPKGPRCVPHSERRELRDAAMVPWDGFLQVDGGSVQGAKPVLFEHGGRYALGGDDVLQPQTTESTVNWRSSTTVHWDGVHFRLQVPKEAFETAQVTISTTQWSRTYPASELANYHLRETTDAIGHEIEIRANIAVEGSHDCNDKRPGSTGRKEMAQKCPGFEVTAKLEESVAAMDDTQAKGVLLSVNSDSGPVSGAHLWVGEKEIGVTDGEGRLIYSLEGSDPNNGVLIRAHWEDCEAFTKLDISQPESSR